MKIGFVGTGTITSAIVTGLHGANTEPCQLRVSPRNAELAKQLANRFPEVAIASSNQDALDHSEIVVLAIRPQIAREVIAELRFRPDHHVLSLVSGLSVGRLSELTAPAGKITRAVPLPSVASRRGPTAIYPPDAVVAGLFAALGTAIEVETEEEYEALCAATATLAPYFGFAGSVAAWLTANGVPQAKARDYTGRIFWGLGNTAVESPGLSFPALAREHATLGGINEQLLAHLVQHGVFDTVSAGLDAILRRIQSASRQP